jgi:hypothetical protein
VADGIVAVRPEARRPDALVDWPRGTMRRTPSSPPGRDRGVHSMGAEFAETDDDLELHDLWRVWVTPSDRKRCTYVMRDEQPLAATGDRAIAAARH